MNATTMKIAGVDLELCATDGGGKQDGAVLFLHSGQGYDPWQAFAAQVAAKRRLVAPSHPGFGKSSLPEWLDSGREGWTMILTGLSAFLAGGAAE